MQGIRKTEAIIRKDLLEKLHQRRVGTHNCEKIASMLVSEGASRRNQNKTFAIVTWCTRS